MAAPRLSPAPRAARTAPAGTAPRETVRETLAWSRAMVDPALRAAVDTLPTSMRRVAGYHFGWWDADGTATDAPAGKALRPALVLLSAAVTGGSPRDSVPAAVAVELVHNFSLLHDDVMDGDTTRRHRATAWHRFGVGAAILAGDALLTLALDVLAASGHPASGRAMRMLSAAVQNLVDGQSADIEFERRDTVDPAECEAMAVHKTAALLGCSCALGSLFGGADAERVRRMRRFGEHLGLAFQHVDDLLGIWGDPAVTGKPVYSDLRNRKKSLPVVRALASDTAAGRQLAALYTGERPPSGAELDRAAALVDAAGGRAWSQTRADELLARALAQLTDPTPHHVPHHPNERGDPDEPTDTTHRPDATKTTAAPGLHSEPGGPNEHSRPGDGGQPGEHGQPDQPDHPGEHSHPSHRSYPGEHGHPSEGGCLDGRAGAGQPTSTNADQLDDPRDHGGAHHPAAETTVSPGRDGDRRSEGSGRRVAAVELEALARLVTRRDH